MLPDFAPSKTQFDLENAYVLMRACQAAYAPDDVSFSGRLKELGIKHNDWKWFTVNFDAGFLAWTNQFVILAFRGTNNPGGWVTNLYGAVPDARPYYYGRVHPGFSDALNSLWDSFYPELAGPRGGLPLFITGHSRGGAIATLAAQSLMDEGIKPVAVYTFGAPRVGTAGFVNKYDMSHHYRVENDRDIVPHVPPRPVFQHVGERRWLDQNGKLVDPPADETPNLPVVNAAFDDAMSNSGSLGRTGVILLGGIASQGGLLSSEFFSDHANTEYAYWLWNQLDEPARTDASKTEYA